MRMVSRLGRYPLLCLGRTDKDCRQNGLQLVGKLHSASTRSTPDEQNRRVGLSEDITRKRNKTATITSQTIVPVPDVVKHTWAR